MLLVKRAGASRSLFLILAIRIRWLSFTATPQPSICFFLVFEFLPQVVDFARPPGTCFLPWTVQRGLEREQLNMGRAYVVWSTLQKLRVNSELQDSLVHLTFRQIKQIMLRFNLVRHILCRVWRQFPPIE